MLIFKSCFSSSDQEKDETTSKQIQPDAEETQEQISNVSNGDAPKTAVVEDGFMFPEPISDEFSMNNSDSDCSTKDVPSAENQSLSLLVEGKKRKSRFLS